MDKQNESICAEEYYSATSTDSIDTRYNMDDSLKHHAYSQNPNTKEQAFYYSTYRKCPEKATLKRQKTDECPELRVRMRSDYKWAQSFFLR